MATCRFRKRATDLAVAEGGRGGGPLGGGWFGAGQLVGIGLLGLGILAAAPASAAGVRYEFSEPHMGVKFRIVLYAPAEGAANLAARAAFDCIEALNAIFSDYDPASELSQLSGSAGSGRRVSVDSRLWDVLCRSQVLARRSEGAFDVTAGPFVVLWRRARKSGLFPTERRRAEAAAAVGYAHVLLDCDDRTVELKRPGMRLDLGGIAKGYAADAARQVLRDHGIRQSLIDAGGDLVLDGPPPGRAGWVVAVAPLPQEEPARKYLQLSGVAVATSGDASQHVEFGGRRYSHLVDPRTGIGLTGRSSVTIVARDGATADSLATAVSVLGPTRGLALVAETPGAEVLIVQEEDGRRRTWASPGFDRLPRTRPRADLGPADR